MRVCNTSTQNTEGELQQAPGQPVLHPESLFQKIFKATVTIWPELDFERSYSIIKQIIIGHTIFFSLTFKNKDQVQLKLSPFGNAICPQTAAYCKQHNPTLRISEVLVVLTNSSRISLELARWLGVREFPAKPDNTLDRRRQTLVTHLLTTTGMPLLTVKFLK